MPPPRPGLDSSIRVRVSCSCRGTSQLGHDCEARMWSRKSLTTVNPLGAFKVVPSSLQPCGNPDVGSFVQSVLGSGFGIQGGTNTTPLIKSSLDISYVRGPGLGPLLSTLAGSRTSRFPSLAMPVATMQ